MADQCVADEHVAAITDFPELASCAPDEAVRLARSLRDLLVRVQRAELEVLRFRSSPADVIHAPDRAS